MPPLATAPYTAAICSGVTATPWPNDTVAMLVPDHFRTGGRIGPTSPGNPIPVFCDSPNRLR